MNNDKAFRKKYLGLIKINEKAMRKIKNNAELTCNIVMRDELMGFVNADVEIIIDEQAMKFLL